MKISSTILVCITAVAALSLARPAFGNLMTDRVAQPRNLADRMLRPDSSNTTATSLPDVNDDMLRIAWRSEMENLWMMRNELRNELVRPSINHSPNPGNAPTLGTVSNTGAVPKGVTVPDGGATVALLGFALLGLAAVRRRLTL